MGFLQLLLIKQGLIAYKCKEINKGSGRKSVFYYYGSKTQRARPT